VGLLRSLHHAELVVGVASSGRARWRGPLPRLAGRTLSSTSLSYVTKCKVAERSEAHADFQSDDAWARSAFAHPTLASLARRAELQRVIRHPWSERDGSRCIE
jgi:hypothetical protein